VEYHTVLQNLKVYLVSTVFIFFDLVVASY